MKKNHIFLILFLLSSLSFSQSNRVEFDYSVFSTDDGGILELYYSYYKVGINASNNGTVKGSLDVKIQNITTNELAVNKNWNFDYKVDNGENDTQALLGVLKYFLDYGSYKCTLVGNCDIASTEIDSSTFLINVNKLPEDSFSISEIQVASSIVQFSTDSSSIFYKNTLEVTPNPSLIFGGELPALYYYAEIYNLDKVNKQSKLSIVIKLFNEYEEEIISKTKRLSIKNPSIVEQGAFKINTYPTGTYNFVLSVVDKEKKIAKISSKKIFLYNPSVIDTSTHSIADRSYTSSEFAALTDEELNMYFDISKYIASPKEKEQWEKLGQVDSKREFLFKFWLNRDSTPESVLNEVKMDYLNRVKFADKNFRSISKNRGSLTERGRVLLMYGHPSDIERHPSDTETKPYEIWLYNEIEGGVIFVFADFYGYSDYRLIHSTKRNELKDNYWQQTLQTY